MMPLALAAALALVPPADTGRALYRGWCSSCHGEDGRGTSKPTVRLEVPAADLADCATSTAEPEERWIAIVRDGGASVGLSMDMPAFGEAATPEQLRAVVRYIRSLCGEPGWPPGELNLPRPFLAEKAFPENEVVIAARGRTQQFIYEHRLGKRLQTEAAVRTAADSAGGLTGLAAAVKYNVWHSLRARALASVGLEVAPPLAQQALWEVEPYLAGGCNPRGGPLVLQGELLGTWEQSEGITGAELRLGAGAQVRRLVPMLEAGWRWPREGPRELTLYPQLWIQVSRLGHVAASVGAELPTAGPGGRPARLVAFILWDYGDGPLSRGW